MTNPFDDEDAQFLVLRNDEAQRSLWPAFAAVPDGWTVEHGPDARPACLALIESVWTDLRPAGLIAATEGAGR